MKRSRFTESQILAVLRQAEVGCLVPDLCREHGISTATFYKWRSKYGGMDASMVSQMKALEEENRRLKRMYAELSMQADLLIGLTQARRGWGFGLCFLHLRTENHCRC
jgi:putative transposase